MKFSFLKIISIRHVSCQYFFYGSSELSGLEAVHDRGFTITPPQVTLRHTTIGRATRINPSQGLMHGKKRNFRKRPTSLFQVGSEPTNSASERPQTHSLDRVSSGIGFLVKYKGTQKTMVLEIQTQHINHRILIFPEHATHTCMTCISES
jgi:hypothetical protein